MCNEVKLQLAKKHVKGSVSIEDLEEQVEAEFPALRGKISGMLAPLKEPMERSKQCYDSVMAAVERQPEYRTLLQEKEVRPDGLKQEEPDFDRLYEDAKACRHVLREVLSDEWVEWKTVGPPDHPTILYTPVPEKKKEWVDNAVDPGVKGKVRGEPPE
jgi:hypothetical protein